MRRAIVVLLGLLVVGSAGISLAQRPGATIEVFKTPTCGCCSLWVEHLKAHGFEVRTTDLNDLTEIKASRGVPGSVTSCHTGVVDGYVIEGHVPASDIQRLLKERPQVAGIGVPGMPIGSPGMEVANMPVQRYQVLAFDRDGRTQVFATHGGR